VSTIDSLLKSIRRVILMESKLQDLAAGLKDVSRAVVNHEGRLIRIETMVEMARGSAAPPLLSDRSEEGSPGLSHNPRLTKG
jgi:hypothetical protein